MNFFKKITNAVKGLFVAAVSVVAVASAGTAAAAGPDFTPITAGVDWASVITGILAVAALAAGVYVAVRGSKMLLGMIRGA